MVNKLTQKQEDFTRYIFEGMSQHNAWIEAGYSSNYPTEIVDQNSCRMANSNKVKARLSELRSLPVSKSVATVEQRRQKLTELLSVERKEPITAKDQISAIAELNRMGGDYAPDKHIIEGEILITPNMRALAAREMMEIKEEEAKLLEGGDAIEQDKE